MSWITKECGTRWNVFVNGVSSSIVLRNSSCSNREEYLSWNRVSTAQLPRVFEGWNSEWIEYVPMSHRGQTAVDEPSALFYYSFARCGQRIAREIYIYINRKGYKVTRCRELKPPVAAILPLKRITDERNEVGWRTNGGLRRKKEKREKEGWKKRRRGNKGKKKYWKKRRRERKESSRRERHVEKVVPLLFFSFSRTHRRSLNPIPLILKQTNTYRMYHGGKWTKGSWDGLGSKEGRRVEREREKKSIKCRHTQREREGEWRMGRTPAQGWFTRGVLIKQKATPYTKLIRVALLPTRAFFASKIFFSSSSRLENSNPFLLSTRTDVAGFSSHFSPSLSRSFTFPSYALLFPLLSFVSATRSKLHRAPTNSLVCSFLPDVCRRNNFPRDKRRILIYFSLIQYSLAI